MNVTVFVCYWIQFRKKSSLSLFVVNSFVCTDVWHLIAFYGTNFKQDGSIFNMNASVRRLIHYIYSFVIHFLSRIVI